MEEEKQVNAPAIIIPPEHQSAPEESAEPIDSHAAVFPSGPSDNDKAVADVANQARDKYDPRTDFEGFVKECGRLFMERRLDEFPKICEVAAIQNFLEWEKLNAVGHKGRFTGTYGWSESRENRFKFIVPRDLYLFMCNMVYREFWTKDNDKIATEFMRRVCAGFDPIETLMWVKTIYGPNSQATIV